jgi:hypothetical protein
MRQRFGFTGLMLAAIGLLLVTCDKKEEETIDPLVGTYTFTPPAVFNDTVRIKIFGGLVSLPPGFDASQFVSEGLLGAAPCDDPANAAVELRNDKTTYYVCLNETNEEQMGTWIINTERTELILNISNPQPFSLNISSLNITGNAFSGTVENFPLPVDASYPLGDPLPGGGVNYQTSSVDLTFTKVP